MSSSDESDSEYADDPTAPTEMGPPHKRKKYNNYQSMTIPALRSSILMKVGKRGNWDSPFTREELNKIYAAMTGEYLVPKPHLYKTHHEEWVSRDEMLVEVAAKAGISEPDDSVWGPHVESPDLFRKSELVTIRMKLQATGDKMVERIKEKNNDE